MVRVKGHLLVPTPPQNDAKSRTHSGAQPSSHSVFLTCLLACLYKTIDTFLLYKFTLKALIFPYRCAPCFTVVKLVNEH